MRGRMRNVSNKVSEEDTFAHVGCRNPDGGMISEMVISGSRGPSPQFYFRSLFPSTLPFVLEDNPEHFAKYKLYGDPQLQDCGRIMILFKLIEVEVRECP